MSLIKKLLIKNGYRITIINAPTDFDFPTEELPENVEMSNEIVGNFDFVLLFAHSKNELENFIPKILPKLKDDSIFWVAYPKKSSKIKTDISRDNGWDILKESGYVGVSLISINEIWSGFRVRNEKFVKRK